MRYFKALWLEYIMLEKLDFSPLYQSKTFG